MLYSTCYTKFELRLRLVLIKCLGMVRTKFNLRLRLDFIKCSTQKTGVGQLPDPIYINYLGNLFKLQMLMAGSCDNIILLFLGQADELNSVTRYTDGEVSVLRLLRMSLCV